MIREHRSLRAAGRRLPADEGANAASGGATESPRQGAEFPTA